MLLNKITLLATFGVQTICKRRTNIFPQQSERNSFEGNQNSFSSPLT